jgi:hypothetical protein
MMLPGNSAGTRMLPTLMYHNTKTVLNPIVLASYSYRTLYMHALGQDARTHYMYVCGLCNI